MSEFEGVLPALESALTNRGYETLTPVQKAVLAPELEGTDILVSAQTGSGKTVAFGLSLAPGLLDGADRFGKAAKPLALAIAPTRELALQVMRELEWLYADTGAKVISCVGGMDMRTERRNLNFGAHIVVGTPGRLRDHVERGSFDTSALKAIVLDEADEMLDMGFRDDLEYILGSAPKDRRTLMFSATVPKSIATLAKRYQRDAVRLNVQSDSKQHVDIQYQALTIAPNDKENAIINVLRYYDSQNAIVFCGTRANVNHLTSRLNNRGFSVVALSGELSQNERTHALQSMRDGRARVCVATDVAARGIDLPNLDLVIHSDIPKNKESLLHRSGRTGRAGRKGTCALIIPHNWRKRTERLLDSARIDAEWAKPPSSDDIMKKDRERILTAEILSEDLTNDDRAFAAELLSRYSAEQIAVAFVRSQTAKQPAPEELLDSGPAPSDRYERQDRKQRSSRDDFKNGVWFSLNVGRKHTAEARWLLPMLCRAGHVTKNEIGAIRIHHDETHVELEPGSVDRFLEAVGPSRKVEKTITVTRLDGIPAEPKDSARDVRGKPYAGKKKEYRNSKPDFKRKSEKPSFDDQDKDGREDKKSWDKPQDKKTSGDKPWDKKKPKGKKPFKAKKSDSGETDKSTVKPTVKPIGKPTNRPKKFVGGPKGGGKAARFAKGTKGKGGKAGSAPLKRKVLKIKGS
ncbi:MAG: ATP-dependent RNA helicase [Rhodospirillaceae bacterium]|nr:MAG: ATP-dependent RNA helicase [Rhodospirillaceae bacterium]